MSRPQIVGPDSGPEPPFPYRMEGKVISGFGRGSKELGIPTANLPVDDVATPWIKSLPSGVYFGHASLAMPEATGSSSNQRSHTPNTNETRDKTDKEEANTVGEFKVYPMVMSIGYNPYYANPTRSAEVHILHSFPHDFYDAHMRLLIQGFIREEKNYDSLELLIDDINTDCEVATRSLARRGWGWDEDGEWLLASL